MCITILLFGCFKHKNKTETTDSIQQCIDLSKNNKSTIIQRKQSLLKAYSNLTSDTLKLKYLTKIAYENLKLKDTFLFKKQNNTILQLALKHKDSFAIGYAYWGYATYYRYFKNDSAFYYYDKAQRYFKRNTYYKAKMIRAKSGIYDGFSEYSKAEELCVKAMFLFKKLNNMDEIGNCYNNLGIYSKEVGNYTESFECYNNALKYLKSEEKKILIYNNIGNLYKTQKNYLKALAYFKKPLIKNLSKKINARTINNIAHTKLLLGDTLGVYTDLKKSLAIRKKLKYKAGILSSNLALSDYSFYKKDTIKGIELLKKANKLAYELKNSKDYLKTLLELGHYDSNHKVYYLENHIGYKDSIKKARRYYLRKFARYSYQTDELIQKNSILENQKKLFFWISGGIFVLFVFGYNYIKIKNRNTKLELENESQVLNEELYLSAIRNQQKIKVSQIEERNRIAQELHDGILSKLFGVRLNLGFLPSYKDEETQIAYEKHLEELQQLEKEIRNVSHQLHSVTTPYAIDFDTAILNLINEKETVGKFELTYDKDDGIYLNNLGDLEKVNLYRILQESLQNIIKHANATKVVLNVYIKKSDLHLVIRDNGVGFNESKVKKGLGINSIKSRIKKIKGKLFFNQNSILLIIPFKTKTNE